MLKNLLGEDLHALISDKAPVSVANITEVRLRLNLPVAIKVGMQRYTLPFCASKKMIDSVVARATGFSLYSRQDEIKQGFINYNNGIRIGVAGKGVAEGGVLSGFSQITSINIRLPFEVKGCSDKLTTIMDGFESTLVISPPYAGKTTLIRDMVRVLGKKYDIAVVDERGEIGGGRDSGYDLGYLVDIIDGVPKTMVCEGIIRAMSPEIVVLDELSANNDMRIIEDITRAGIKLLASVHSDSIERLLQCLPQLKSYFVYGVLLSNKPTMGSIKSIVRFRGD